MKNMTSRKSEATIGINNMVVDVNLLTSKEENPPYRCLELSFSNLTDAAGETIISIGGVELREVRELAKALLEVTK